jgi:hypothetical protein
VRGKTKKNLNKARGSSANWAHVLPNRDKDLKEKEKEKNNWFVAPKQGAFHVTKK